MKFVREAILLWFVCLLSAGCSTSGAVVTVTDVTELEMNGLDKKELARLAEIKGVEQKEKNGLGLNSVIKETVNHTVAEYLIRNPDANNPVIRDYKVGSHDILDITVYEEEDLSRKGISVSTDGDISFPLIGRLKIDDYTTSEIEKIISDKLAEGLFLIDANVSVTVSGYHSKQFMVLGDPVKMPGSYSLKAQERVLDAISKAGGIDFELGGNELIIIRTENPDTANEKKAVIRINLPALLNEGNQQANLLLMDKDLLYIPRARHFYIIGQVKKPGSFLYLGKEITLVEAISMAGGFTKIAARNSTRIVRLEDDMEKIIEVKVDAITNAGKKGQDVVIIPGDVIIVPESFF